MSAALIIAASAIAMSCSGTQTSLVGEHPVNFEMEVSEDTIAGRGDPFVWVTGQLDRSDRRRWHQAYENLFVGEDGGIILEMSLSNDLRTVSWAVIEPTAQSGKFYVGISGRASCHAKKTEEIES